MDTKKIAAVVVTYNRLDLLKKCIEGLRKQTQKIDSILIVNNGSTDGSTEWLSLQNDLVVFNQSNVGGAGGFYRGMKEAYEMGFEWIWVMDDDGTPVNDTLLNLIKFTSKALVISSLIIDSNNHAQLAFVGPNEKTLLEEVLNGQEVIENYSCFFNSILFNRLVFSKVGFPLKELFIWGDEREFSARIRKNGIKTITVTSSLFYHPKDRLYDKKYKGMYIYSEVFSWKAYCFYRNNAYISFRYSKSYNIKSTLIQASYNLKKFGFLNGLKFNFSMLGAIYDGLKGDLSRKLPF